MSYRAAEGRWEILEALGEATDGLAAALAALGAAYELLDEDSADRLEEDVFRPVQAAYGRAKRTHAGFAQRSAVAPRAFEAADEPPAGAGVAELVADAVEAVTHADDILSELQDTMLPVTVGDPELRAGLAQVRELIGGVTQAARRFTRGLGR